jgi:hypothetical protein
MRLMPGGCSRSHLLLLRTELLADTMPLRSVSRSSAWPPPSPSVLHHPGCMATTAPHLTPPHTSLDPLTAPHTSPHLPTPPHTSPHLLTPLDTSSRHADTSSQLTHTSPHLLTPHLLTDHSPLTHSLLIVRGSQFTYSSHSQTHSTSI